MIKFNKVSYKYYSNKENILTDLSFNIQKGEFVLILGKNGSGKTTLLSLISSLILPTEGEIIFSGTNIKNKHFEKKCRNKIGYVFQNPYNSFFQKTIFEEITWILKNYNIENRESKYNYYMKLFGLNPFLLKDRNPRDLSLSEKKKIAIISNIIHEPSLILMDEPNVLFDFFSYENLLSFLNESKRKEQTIIISTNYPENYYFLTNRIIYLKEKVILFDGLPKDFINKNV